MQQSNAFFKISASLLAAIQKTACANDSLSNDFSNR